MKVGDSVNNDTWRQVSDNENDSLTPQQFQQAAESLGFKTTEDDFTKATSKSDGVMGKKQFVKWLSGVNEVTAIKSVFLGKKSYIDRIRDKLGNVAYHIRLKDIPGKCVQAKVDQCYDGDPMAMFEDLFRGATVEFDLTSGGNCVFKTHKDHTITTERLIRKVRF